MEGLLEASITDLQTALTSGTVTSVDLVSSYLCRIAVYDADGPNLSAVPVLNLQVFEEAMASDLRRRSPRGARSPLEGIPFLVKDNIKVRGMEVSSGSPAFENLIASSDAACVQLLRKAGAVLLGRTNMPPVAYGGMQRGIWGRAESPYNSDYLPAAYVSGSSNGSGVATSANMCAFSLGSETVSSGRSPASNNSVVAYTPSRGWLPLEGVFPLYPTCDVVVPLTRSVEDMLLVLEALCAPDSEPGDFWRDQPFVRLPPVPRFFSPSSPNSLAGKRIGVPEMYIGGDDSDIDSISRVKVRPSILALWKETKSVLETCGAKVITTKDFPLVTVYESQASKGQLVTVEGLPDGWPAVERSDLVAHAWDDFLRKNGQRNLDSIARVHPDSIFPLAPGSLPGTPENANRLKWEDIVNYPVSGKMPASIFDIPRIGEALTALEQARKKTFEDWMDNLHLDAVVFPANADVGSSNADIDLKASSFAWTNGVKYSNGNRAIRHLGVPSVSVPMGLMADIAMPVNLTFIGKAYSDEILMDFAHCFECARKGRVPPILTPVLNTDTFPGKKTSAKSGLDRSEIIISKNEKKIGDDNMVYITVTGFDPSKDADIRGYVNGHYAKVERDPDDLTNWNLHYHYPRSQHEESWKLWESPLLRQTIVTIIVDKGRALPAGKLLIL